MSSLCIFLKTKVDGLHFQENTHLSNFLSTVLIFNGPASSMDVEKDCSNLRFSNVAPLLAFSSIFNAFLSL